MKRNGLFLIPFLQSISCLQKLLIDGITRETETVAKILGVFIDENVT